MAFEDLILLCQGLRAEALDVVNQVQYASQQPRRSYGRRGSSITLWPSTERIHFGFDNALPQMRNVSVARASMSVTSNDGKMCAWQRELRQSGECGMLVWIGLVIFPASGGTPARSDIA